MNVSLYTCIIIPIIVAILFLYLANIVCNKSRASLITNKTESVPIPGDVLLRKLSAIERLILFLERSRPMRVYQRMPGNIDSASKAHLFYRQTIDQEFFHNIVQQAYISNETWEAIKEAKFQLEKIADDVIKKVPPNSETATFFKTMEQLYESLEDPFIENTIDLLKREISNYGVNVT